jgi:aryl-alcohol dehydrogenase-like predicted oxidoreductase
MRPAELLFEQAKKRQVGIIARVPLASGLLTGKLGRHTQFAPDDHRNFNRHGEAFDVGETFSGVDYEQALDAVDELRRVAPADMSLATLALRWIAYREASTGDSLARLFAARRDFAQETVQYVIPVLVEVQR